MSHQAEDDKSLFWDNEAGHMLSYFLDENGVSSPPCPPSTTPSYAGSLVSHNLAVSDRILQHPFRTSSFQTSGVTATATKCHRRNQLGFDCANDGHRRPPSTPVIQHYFPSSSLSKHTSGSSFTETRQQPPYPQQFIRPVLQQYHQQMQQNVQLQHQQQRALDPIHSMKASLTGPIDNPLISHSEDNNSAHQEYNPGMEDVSPISPALEFIGEDSEPLLFPAVERRNNNDGNSSLNDYSISNRDSIPNATTATSIATTTPKIPNMPLHIHNPSVSNNKKDNNTWPIPSNASENTFASTNVASLHPMVATELATAVSNPFVFPHVSVAYLKHKVESIEESEGKKVQRLERNRESARKSRRRKKERLSTLETKVNRLYSKLELERRNQINCMLNSTFVNLDKQQIIQLKEEYDMRGDRKDQFCNNKRAIKSFPNNLIDQIEPPILYEVVEFQYNTLSQHFIQKYQKFLLWLMMQSESYFMIAKDEHSERKQSDKISTGKISSKQIGKELSNGRKVDGKKKPKKKISEDDISSESCHSSDTSRMWPLICFELSISVEQEDRLVQSFRARNDDNIKNDVSQIVAASRLASSLKEAVLYQLYASSFRKRKTYLDILTPQQTILYQEWLLSNRLRSKILLSKNRNRPSTPKANNLSSVEIPSISPPLVLGSSRTNDASLTLEQLCRHLDESLKVTKTKTILR